MKYTSGYFLGYAVLTFIIHQFNVHAESVGCKDLQGRSYQSGFHYIPGPESCTLCICDNGNPKWCRPFICKFPEEGCKSFRRGETCCEFVCLDEPFLSISNEKPDGSGGNLTDGSANYDIGLRSVASFVTAILSLSLLFFLIHRLRQRKIRVCVAGRQSRQLAEDQRNLGNIDYLERGGIPHGIQMDDIRCTGGYPLWKPASNYFPRGEAPPPYEEAVAAARAEQALLSISPHMLSPLNLPSGYLADSDSHSNIPVITSSQEALTVTSQMPSNNNDAVTTPLVSSTSGVTISPLNTYVNCQQLSQNEQPNGMNAGASSISFVVPTDTYENLPTSTCVANLTYQHSTLNDTQPPSTSSHSIKNYRQHTTFPRQNGAFTISANLLNPDISTHRTIPRTLTNHTVTRMPDVVNDRATDDLFHLSANLSTKNLSPSNLPQPVLPKDEDISQTVNVFNKDTLTTLPSTVSQVEQPQNDTVTEKINESKPALSTANKMNEDGSFDSVTCTCSMQTLPTLHDDGDDYRSECENCKSATGSRYYLDNEDELVTSPHETMTLHRRPEETASSSTPQYYRTSLTLPTSTRQRTRSTGVRENWFNTMPQSSTESSDEN